MVCLRQTFNSWKNVIQATLYDVFFPFSFFYITWSPAFLQRLVDQDNDKFEEWCSEMADMRKQSVDKGKAKHEEVKELYELLPARDGQ